MREAAGYEQIPARRTRARSPRLTRPARRMRNCDQTVFLRGVPRTAAQRGPPRPSAAAGKSASAPRNSACSITLLKKGLEQENHSVAVACDGVEGLRGAGDYELDALVLDVTLPGLDGYEDARRRRGRANATPILMLTPRDAPWSSPSRLPESARPYFTAGGRIMAALRKFEALRAGRRGPKYPNTIGAVRAPAAKSGLRGAF